MHFILLLIQILLKLFFFSITDSSAKLSTNAFFFSESAVSYNDLGKSENIKPKIHATSQSHKMEVVKERRRISHLV